MMLKKSINPSNIFQLWLIPLFTLLIVTAGHAGTIEDVIPADSFLYVKIQNLENCRKAIEASESWQEASDMITAAPKWQMLNQFIETLPMFLGTDLQGFLDTVFGDQIALSISSNDQGLLIGLVIRNEGKTADAENTFVTLLNTFANLQGNSARFLEYEYRGIAYQTVDIGGEKFSYSRINDFFLVGITAESLEKMIDAYQTETDRITLNPVYRSAVDTCGEGEVFAFADVPKAAPYLKTLLPPAIGQNIEAFRTLVYRWDLLNPGSGHRLSGQLNANYQNTPIGYLKTDLPLKTTRGLSGTEAFFVSFSASSASLFWNGIINGAEFPSEVSNFLLPPVNDLQAALAGEMTFAVDVSNLINHLQNLYLVESNKTPHGTIESVRLSFPEFNAGLIFKPDAPEKWETVFKGFLAKFPDASEYQFTYKGITGSITDIPSNLYYGNVNGFFILALSEQQFQTMVDNLLNEIDTNDLQERLTTLTATPTALIQLELGALINAVIKENPWILPEAAAFLSEMAPLLGSIVVQEDTAWIDIAHAPSENGIEAMSKLTPFFLLSIVEHLQIGQ